MRVDGVVDLVEASRAGVGTSLALVPDASVVGRPLDDLVAQVLYAEAEMADMRLSMVEAAIRAGEALIAAKAAIQTVMSRLYAAEDQISAAIGTHEGLKA